MSDPQGRGRACPPESVGQVFDPTRFPGKRKFATFVKSNPRGIITSVFQAAQTVYEGFLSAAFA
jgi:hypothetical protein